MIESTIFILISILISISGILYVIKYREKFGAKLNSFFIILIFFLLGIGYSLTQNLAYSSYFKEAEAIVLWKTSVVIAMISLCALSLIHSVTLEYKKTSLLPSFIYAFFGGLITYSLFQKDSVIVKKQHNISVFLVQNLGLFVHLIIFSIIIFCIVWYFQIKNIKSFRNNKDRNILNYLLLIYSGFAIVFIIYFATLIEIFWILYNVLFLLCVSITLYLIIKKPEIFIALTNKIYNFVVFHKSGILLYAFNFNTGKEMDESVLKGTILIGINHILSEFKDKKNQLNLIKIKNRDLILEFDITYGYSILLITNYKNAIIEKAVRNFMTQFSDVFKEKLSEINKSRSFIDISDFKRTKNIIERNFYPYITKN